MGFFSRDDDGYVSPFDVDDAPDYVDPDVRARELSDAVDRDQDRREASRRPAAAPSPKGKEKPSDARGARPSQAKTVRKRPMASGPVSDVPSPTGRTKRRSKPFTALALLAAVFILPLIVRVLNAY